MKKIIVFVFNDFLHDSRVMNVSASLSDFGYDVDVLASKHIKGLPLFEKNNKYKINRIPLFSSLYTKMIKGNSSNLYEKPNNLKHKIFIKIKQNRFRKIVISFINCLFYNTGILFLSLLKHPDIVYCNDLITLTAGYLISKILKSKIIFDSHELWLYGATFEDSTLIRQKYWKYIQKKLINKVDAVIVTTNYRAKILKEQYNLDKVYVVRNCPKYQDMANSNLFRKEFKIPDSKLILLYQGSLRKKRGVFTIVDIVEKLPNVVMIFMGMGRDKENLKKYIYQKALNNRIFVKDAVQPDELLTFTSSADIGLQLLSNTGLNHYSTISNKLFEYIMAGIVILASDFPEIRKIVRDNEFGEVVNPDNPDEIFQVLNEMIQNPDRISLFKRNLRIKRNLFSWEKEQEILKEIINNVF